MVFIFRKYGCDELFIGLHRKKDFNKEELKKIKSKFIRVSSLSLISRLSETRLPSILFLVCIILFITSGMNLVDLEVLFVSYIIVLSILKGFLIAYFNSINDYIKISRMTKIVSMSYNKKFVGKSDEELSKEIDVNYKEALEILVKEIPKNKKISMYTHQLMKLGIERKFKNVDDLQIEYKELGYKIIKEKFMNYSFKDCIRLYSSIGNSYNKDFRLVLKLLKVEKCYRITIKRI